MKKIVSLLLVLVMLLSMSACGAASTPETPNTPDTPAAEPAVEFDPADFSEKVDFSMSFAYMDSAVDYEDALTKWVEEKFNTDIEITFISNSDHTATVRTWVNGGTMPNQTVILSLNINEYKDWIDQGLVRALPDGWEENYPNLKRMIDKTAIGDFLKVDGKTYAIPHAVFCNFVDVDPIPWATTMYYRADWAEELGYDFVGKDTVTFSEFKDYLTACVEKDMAGNGNTIGLSSTVFYTNGLFMNNLGGIQYEGFGKNADNTAYQWSPEGNKAVIEAQIAEMREWYKNGLLDADYYNIENTEAQNRFASGLSAACFAGCHLHGMREFSSVYSQVNSNGDFFDNVETIMITTDDGTLYTPEQTNWYSYSLFNPDTTDAQMHRMLAIADWLCTVDGEYTAWMGIPEVDWKYEADGSVLSGTEYPSSMMWCFMSIVSDDFSFMSPAANQDHRARLIEIYDTLEGATYVPYSYEYNFHSSELKGQYSVDIRSKITELVVGDTDIATGWDAFLTEYEKMVDPLVEELNTTYCAN